MSKRKKKNRRNDNTTTKLVIITAIINLVNSLITMLDKVIELLSR